MKEVVGFIKDGDSAVQIIPMLKEYLEINVKNDEQLVKLATIVQRITAAEKLKMCISIFPIFPAMATGYIC